MKIIFISGALPNDILAEYDNKYAKKTQRNVQQWWDYSLAVQLRQQCGEENFFAISFPPVSTYPASKCLFHKARTVTTKDGFLIFLPRMCNLAGVRHINLMNTIYRKIRAIVKKFPEEKIVILTHCIYLQSAIPAHRAKKFSKVEIYTIVPDLPEHATGQALNGHKLLKKLFSIYTKWTLPLKYKFDGYICFSKHQMEHLNKERPYMVMEGFIDCTMFDEVQPQEFAVPRIVYAGGVMYRYGMKELVEGFCKANIQGVELWIYGDGDAVDYIKGKESERVFYGGCVSRQEMLSIEKGAFMLVNPRPTEDEYSRCSFPSKLMEYMSSGTPVFTSRLGSIGEEYFDKMNFFEEISVDGIAKALQDGMLHVDELQSKAQLAKDYVKEYKNVVYQTERIYKFLGR